MPTSAYLAQQAAIDHQVQWLVEIELDRCSLQYTTAPCAATDQGDNSRCYYSFPTCQDPQNFNRTTRIYRFCLNRVPWPDNTVQVYPYLQGTFVGLPQSIDPGKLFTYPEKVTVKMLADWGPPALDTDKTLSNSTTAGEFWRNLIARNRNYVGRPLRIYRGFNASGFLVGDFLKVGPSYKLTEINVTKDGVTITAESELALLNTKQIPFTITDDNTIQDAAGIGAVATTVTVLRASEYPNPADYSRFLVYARIENEIVSVTNRNTTTQVLTIGRGKLGTTAAVHALGAKVEHVVYFGTPGTGAPTPRNVIEVMHDLLHWAGIPDASINTTELFNIQTDVWTKDDTERLVTRPGRISRHMQGLRETRGIVIFLDSDGLWSAAVLAPSTSVLTSIDEDRELEGMTKVEEDEESRITRCALWWNPIVENPGEDSKDYASGAIGIDAELEQTNNFGDIKPKVFYDPWISAQTPVAIVRNISRRVVTRLRYGLRKITFSLGLVDNELDVGDQRLFSSRHLLDRNGAQAARPILILSRKETGPSRTEYTAVDVNFGGRYLRIGEDTLTDSYDSASAADKQYGYWGDAQNRVGSQKDQGYIFW